MENSCLRKIRQGKAVWQIDNTDIEMNTGDYLIIPLKQLCQLKR